MIEGIGLLCQRYDGDLAEQRAVERLSAAHGGVSGLVSRAGQLRQSTGSATAQCVAAAAVEVINRGSGGPEAPRLVEERPMTSPPPTAAPGCVGVAISPPR